jgi:hypothetical protein
MEASILMISIGISDANSSVNMNEEEEKPETVAQYSHNKDYML